MVSQNPVPGHTTSGGTRINNLNNQNIFVQDIRGEIYFTNDSLSPVECDLYHLICKQDTTDSSVQTIAAMDNQQQGNNVIGLDQKTYVDFGTYPRSSAKFNKFWKIVKTHRINISGGGVYKHAFKINYNKVIAKDRYANCINVSPYTHQWLLISRGFPV